MEKIREKILQVKFSKFWKLYQAGALANLYGPLWLMAGLCGKSFYTRCPSCGRECSQEEKFCSACGHAVEEAKDGENL